MQNIPRNHKDQIPEDVDQMLTKSESYHGGRSAPAEKL